MLDMGIIEDEIEALEQEETTYETCERLATLYTVRQEQNRRKAEERASQSSDFLAASVGAPLPDLMRVMDEHMEALRILYPKEYETVVSKIRALHE